MCESSDVHRVATGVQKIWQLFGEDRCPISQCHPIGPHDKVVQRTPEGIAQQCNFSEGRAFVLRARAPPPMTARKSRTATSNQCG